MKRWLLFFLTLLLAACSSAPASVTQPSSSRYPDLGSAPELAGDTWLNTIAPLSLAGLRGKVVLVDMWTYG